MASGSDIIYTITGLAFAASVFVSGPAVAQQVADSAHSNPTPKVEVGVYPNHSNYGVNGNPAMLFQLGECAYLGAGRYADGSKGVDLSVSKTVGKGAIVSPFASSSTSGQNSSTVGVDVSIEMGEKIFLGGEVSKTEQSGSKSSTGSLAGLGFISTGKGYMVRIGAMESFSDYSKQIAAEIRRKTILNLEATLSGKITVKDGKIAGKGMGAQLKKGSNLVSVGVGGPDWTDMKLHYRRFLKGAAVDFHVSGAVKSITRKPGYVGVGVLKFF